MRGVTTSPDERWFPSHLREIDKAECLELLAAHTVGRVAYCDDLGPVVLPVNYALDHDTVLIQISPHSTLATHLRSARASFQIDDFDDYNQSGWSVLVRGNAAYVETADLPDDDRPVAWAEGQRTLHVRITPHDISGRRLLSA
jgi:nitroimidazol reductase NimA-like FMN-containing flavoprotein (pyridoxamine 5'-phosphate oxidase superfamily)